MIGLIAQRLTDLDVDSCYGAQQRRTLWHASWHHRMELDYCLWAAHGLSRVQQAAPDVKASEPSPDHHLWFHPPL